MPKQEKVLVTGANGLLGSNVVKQLNLQGYLVVVLVRKGSNRLALKGLEYKLIEGNISNVFDIDKAISGCDYVIHCAANTSQYKKPSENIKQDNVNTTALLIQLSKLHHIKRFIFVSTANCFTNGDINNSGNECSNFMPWLKKSNYAYSKYLAQKLVLNEVSENDFPALIVAPTFLIGAQDAKLSSGKLIMHAANKQFVFYPPGGKSFVDVEYAAQATANALKLGMVGECYLLAGENMSYRSFYAKLIKENRQKSWLLPIPKTILILGGFLCNFIEAIFRISLPFNRTNQRLLCLNNYFTNAKAHEQLAMKHSNTNEALKKSIHWFKQENYIA